MLAGLLAVIGIVLLLFFYLAGVVVFNGWVLSKLWLWFAVPTFGLKPLTVIQAIGIALIVRFLTSDPEAAKKSDKKELWETLIFPFIYCGFALLFGYLVRMFL